LEDRIILLRGGFGPRTIQWTKEGQKIQWTKEEGQTIQRTKEEGQTIQCPKEEIQTI
jgi:ribosomal protein L24E